MTAAEITLWATPLREGCTHPGCGRQDTATLDAYHGRRCPAHPPQGDPTPAAGGGAR